MAQQDTNPFVEAKKEQAKLRMAINGPSGSGKTWTSLLIAERLAELEEGKIAFLDTEGRSARKYADRFTFDVYDLSNDYSPEKYIDGILAAARFGYSVIVIDSFTHAWNGAGGVLDIVDNAGKKMGGNDWAGWSKGRPAQNSLVDALINADIHVIGTMRTKTDWVLEVDSRGKTKPVKKGLAPVQSSDFEYEFDVVVQISMEHQMTISKSRCAELPVNEEYPHDSPYEIANMLHAWLTDGEIYRKLQWYDEMSAIQKIITWANGKDYGNNEPELLNLLGVKDWSSFEDGKKACTAIHNAHNALAEELASKSSSPEEPIEEPATDTAPPEPTWTREDTELFEAHIRKHYDKGIEELAELPEDTFALDFAVNYANSGEAINKINKVAEANEWDMIVNSFKVVQAKAGGNLVFETPLGNILHYSRSKFAALIGEEFQNQNELDIANLEPGTYENLDHMKISWKNQKSGKSVVGAIAFDPYADIPI